MSAFRTEHDHLVTHCPASMVNDEYFTSGYLNCMKEIFGDVVLKNQNLIAATKLMYLKRALSEAAEALICNDSLTKEGLDTRLEHSL